MDFKRSRTAYILLHCIIPLATSLSAPDLHWSFEESCTDHCEICIDSDLPIGDSYVLRGSCTNTTLTEPDNLVGGFFGEALFIEGIEVTVKNATQSCITDLDKKAPIPGFENLVGSICSGLTFTFWVNIEELPLTRGFLFRTASYNQEYNPDSVGIGLSISQDAEIIGNVQTSGVSYQATTRANSVQLSEWTHIILSWSAKPLNILINGTSVVARTRTFDIPRLERDNKEISFGDLGIVNFTIDEVKIWFGVQDNDEVFRDAVTPPTVPPTTSPEQTTLDETTEISLSYSTTSTPEDVLNGAMSKFEEATQDLHENEETNSQTEFDTSDVLTESSQETKKVNEHLTDVIEDEGITLKPEEALEYLKTVSENTNSFTSSENVETWRRVSNATELLNSILESADNTTDSIVASIDTTADYTETQSQTNNGVSLVIVPIETNSDITVKPTIDTEIFISGETVSKLAQNQSVVVAASVRSGAQICYDLSADEVDIIRPENENGTDSNIESEAGNLADITKFQIISEVVSVNIKPKPVNQEIRLTFRHIRDISELRNFTLYCAYIDKITARWTHHKCNIIETNNTHTSFISNHLTNFAILMQIVDFEIPESDRKNLALITYVGLSISVFCLVLSLCIFALVNNVTRQKTERYHLHANLALSMLLGQVTFLAGSGHPPGTDSCKATAILLHFFYLTAFNWMLIEGLHLYNLVVKVFKSADSKLGYYYMLGWGLPMLICVISVAAAFDGYGERENCWLDVNNSRVIWAFVGPVLFIIMTNSIILIKVTRVISSLAKSRDNCIKCMTDVAAMAICAKAVAVLMPILGVTWIFGIIAVNQNLIVFQYIFAIFNSLQGFFLFMFHCVFNTETRSSLLYRTRSMRPGLPTNSGNLKGRKGAKRRNKINSRTPWNEMLGRSRENIVEEIPPTSTRQNSTTTESSQNTENDIRQSRRLVRTSRRHQGTPINAW